MASAPPEWQPPLDALPFGESVQRQASPGPRGTIDPDHAEPGAPSATELLRRWSTPRTFRFSPQGVSPELEGLSWSTVALVTLAPDPWWPPVRDVRGPGILSVPVVGVLHADAGWTAGFAATVDRAPDGVETLASPLRTTPRIDLVATTACPHLLAALRGALPTFDRLWVRWPVGGELLLHVDYTAPDGRHTASAAATLEPLL